MNRWILALLLTMSSFAGQSLVLDNPGGSLKAVTFTDTSYPSDAPWRAEFQLHGLSANGYRQVFALNGIGLQVALESGTTMYFRDIGNTYSGAIGSCGKPVKSSENYLIRVQRWPTELTCEMWELNSGDYTARRVNRTATGTPSSGGRIGHLSDAVLTASIGFIRVHNTLVPLNSRPPVTADTSNVIRAWRLDGNGLATAGGVNINTSVFPFVTSPIGKGVFAKPWQLSRKPWMQVAPPLRAGHTNADLISSSFSLSDTSAEVTCFWQQVSGPSKLVWVNRNVCEPIVSGLVFGEYIIRLRVQDVDGRINTADYTVGAVSYDDNGVVIYKDSRLKKLIGPTMAWGKNPWEHADQKHWEMAAYLWAGYGLNGGNLEADHVLSEVNGTPRLGTITRGWNGTPPGGFPSDKVYGNGTNFLEVFCGGRAGPAVPFTFLHFDMRDYSHFSNGGSFAMVPVTSCESDTELTVSGSLGWPGYAEAPGVPWRTFNLMRLVREGVTGTVTVDTAVNRRKVYGIGTNFRTIICGGGSTPVGHDGIYIFGATYVEERGVASCESETEITLSSDFAQPTIVSPGVNWAARSVKNNSGFYKLGGPPTTVSFYEVPVAHYILWMRTGLNAPRDAWRWLATRVWNSPEGEPRYSNYITTVLLHEFDDVDLPAPLKDRDHLWNSFLQKLPTGNRFPGQGDNGLILDQRESGYALLANALVADFHPDPAIRATFRGRLQTFYDYSVKGSQDANGAFATSLQVVYSSERSFVMSNGSATATLNTGTIPPNLCGNTATFYSAGSIATITNGSTAITGSGVNWTGQANKDILLRGTRGGLPWSQRNRLSATPTSTTGTLAWPWWGDSNSVVAYRIGEAIPLTTMVVNSSNGLAFPNTRMEDDWYWCTVTSGTTVELDRPFTGDTGGGNIYRRLLMNSIGHSTSVFLNSILATTLFYASNVDELNPVLANNYREAARKLMNHMRRMSARFGYGILQYWETNNPFCGGYDAPFPNWCAPSVPPAGLPAMKSFAIENVWPLTLEYELYGEEWRREVTDQWYTNLFDAPNYSSPFSAADKTLPDVLGDYQFGVNASKFYGQTFGMGNAQAWPAQRAGGESPRADRNLLVSFSMEDIPAATQFRLIIYFPSGEVRTTVCTQSPCSIQIDERQGDHWMLKQYLDANGSVIAESSREIVRIQ